jgi:flagellar hook-basal body complex protein FliE
MPDSIQIPGPRSAPIASPAQSRPARPVESASGPSFAAELREQLEQVSRMQTEADQSVQNLLTGRSDNITQVFTATRKAEIAFSLLMEIRNKLVDAYTELKQLRV